MIEVMARAEADAVKTKVEEARAETEALQVAPLHQETERASGRSEAAVDDTSAPRSEYDAAIKVCEA